MSDNNDETVILASVTLIFSSRALLCNINGLERKASFYVC